MCKRKSRRKGQGLVEYALILVLVAVVSLVILNLFGRSAQRIFGLVTASLGTKVNGNGLTIAYAECTVNRGSNRTTLWVRGRTNYPLNTLMASTDKNFGGDIDENDIFRGEGSTGAGTFKYTSTLANKADGSNCPRAVVIQSEGGALAAWPVEVAEVN